MERIRQRLTQTQLITAGYFLDRREMHTEQFKKLMTDKNYVEVFVKVLQSAFDTSAAVHSHCLCSPDGFTPITALRRQYCPLKGRILETCMSLLQWPIGMLERHVRAFALGEVFDRLQMTHTCVDIHNPGQQIPEEDRLEIEDEEEKFHNQLKELMEEYDLGWANFRGDPFKYLDLFFETHEYDVPSCDGPHWHYIGTDKDLLGPGYSYRSSRLSFTGRRLYYGHKEKVREENMLGLLFDESSL
jgi:hypothetical protein